MTDTTLTQPSGTGPTAPSNGATLGARTGSMFPLAPAAEGRQVAPVCFPSGITPAGLDGLLAYCDAVWTSRQDTSSGTVIPIACDEHTAPFYYTIGELFRAANSATFHFDIVGFAEPLRFSIYPTGGGLDWHVDNDPDYMTSAPRKLAISLQLLDGDAYEGGDFEALVGPEPTPAPRERGTAIIFPAYTLHRVTPVTQGTRKSLVAWVTGPELR